MRFAGYLPIVAIVFSLACNNPQPTSDSIAPSTSSSIDESQHIIRLVDPDDPPAEAPKVAVWKQFVDKHCLSCHNDKKESGGLSLAHASQKSIGADRQTWESIRRRVMLKEMPPKKQPQPADDERKEFVGWIDGELKKAVAASASPGRVTMRRLNKVEYNRTVQELCGVDMYPAADFPADDVGNGFDNIGDVLSLPPILFEKYLAASERIVERIFAGEPVTPTVRKYFAKELQTTTKIELSGREGRQAQLLDKAGAVFVMHDVPHDGELIVRATVFTRPSVADLKGEKVRVAFRLDGKPFLTRDVDRPTPNQVVGTVKVTKGQHRVAVALLNPSDDMVTEKRKTLGVVLIEVENPVEQKKPKSYERVMIGDPADESRERARRILGQFARRGFRRPVEFSEIERLMKLFDMARKDGESFDKAVAVGLQAVLVSPHFLFRVESDRKPDRPDKSYPLNDWEVASRLSYFLWSTMPDDELFRLAGQGRLRDPAVLEAQVKRMLADPKSFALVRHFGGQWLNLRNLATIQPAKRDFPLFDDQLRNAMRTETELFFQSIIREDRSILEFIDSDFTHLNGRLARHYGVSGVSGDQFQRVKLTDRNRGGVLTHASVLTVTSNPTRTSPVKRGKWIMENILGTPPPPPPPDVPELKEGKEALKGTLRERMQQHRANPNCATCHEHMDTIGFGFENFDAIGGWRSEDGSFKIDASGTLPDGKTFRTPAELKQLLKRDEDSFRKCLSEKLLTYALGRGVEPGDRAEIDRISKATAADGNRFNRMVLEIVKGDAFLRRTVRK